MGSRFDVERKKLIAALRKLLAAEPEGKALTAFADILFEHVAGEDLVEYDPAALAAISRASLRILPPPRGADSSQGGGACRSRQPGPAAQRHRALHGQPPLHLRFRAGRAAGRRPSGAAGGASDPRGRAATRQARRCSFAPAGREPTSGCAARKLRARARAADPRCGGRRRARPVVEDAARRGAARHRRLARDARAPAHAPITDFRLDHPPLPEAVAGRDVAFLQWLEEDNFVFLGMREYSYTGAADWADRGSGGGKRPRPARAIPP